MSAGSGRLSSTAEKLKIGGGKERMASLFSEQEFQRVFAVPGSEEDRKALITKWHKAKTAIYQQIISSGAIPPRSGIKRITDAALAAGWKLAVASTSAQLSVEAVLTHAVGDAAAKRFTVLAGDVVAAKKPAPDVYLLAIKRLGIAPEHCVAIEDSRNGLLSADSAGIRVLVTTSSFTTGEDFSEARLVVSALGDPGGEQSSVRENRIGRRCRRLCRIGRFGSGPLRVTFAMASYGGHLNDHPAKQRPGSRFSRN